MSNSRTVTVFNTKGGKPKKIETTATQWGDLRSQIESEGFNVDKLLATESVTKRDLNNNQAELPEGNFVVYLRPKKTKSGASYSYKEAKAEIKDLIEKYGDHAKDHFCNKYPRNYTQMSTADLNVAIDEYEAPSGTTPTAAQESPAQNVADVAETVTSQSPSGMVDTAIAQLKKVCEVTGDDDICERTNDVIEQIEGLKADVADWENPEAAQARREEEERLAAEKAEEERLAREAEELGDEFND